MLELHNVLLNGKSEISPINYTFEKRNLYTVIDRPDDSVWEFLRILAGMKDPAAGEMVFHGGSFGKKNYDLRRKISYVERHPVLDGEMTAFEWLSFLGNVKKVPSAKLVKQIRAATELCGLSDGLIAKFSESDRKKLALAGALIGNPTVIMLDKPFSMSDDTLNTKIGGILAELAQKKCVIVACDKNQVSYCGECIRFDFSKDETDKRSDADARNDLLYKEKGEE